MEDAQANTLRRLLKVPMSTPYMGILNETGIWPVEYQLMYKRLMLYHNIVNSNDCREVKKLILEQERRPIGKCWASKVKEDAEELGLKLQTIKKDLKSKAKKKIKAAARNKIKNMMKGITTTKMRTVTKTKFETKPYLNGSFSADDVSVILQIKLHMLSFKENYRSNNISNECRLCGKCEETTEHIFLVCPMLETIRRGIGLKEETLESTEVSECAKLVRYKKKCDLLFSSPLDERKVKVQIGQKRKRKATLCEIECG